MLVLGQGLGSHVKHCVLHWIRRYRDLLLALMTVMTVRIAQVIQHTIDPPNVYASGRSGGANWLQLDADNTLIIEGERPAGCIRNGILLAGGGHLLLLRSKSLKNPLVEEAFLEWGDNLRGIIDRLT